MSKTDVTCSLIQWIAKAETQLSGGKTPFSNAISRTCIQKSFERKHFGVTLLFPVDTGYREHLFKQTDSGKQDDLENAQLEMLTLLMPEAVFEGKDLVSADRTPNTKNEPGPLGNWLGEVYVFKKVSDSEYSLNIEGKEYATITNKPPKGLEGLQHFYTSKSPALKMQNKYSVWFLSFKSGVDRLPYDKNLPQKFQRKVMQKSSSKGAAVTGRGEVIHSIDLETADRRLMLAKQLEAEFAKQMLADRCKSNHPYLPVVTSLLNYMCALKPTLYAKIITVVDYDPFITFYLLVEPYKQKGNFLIPNEDLFSKEAAWNYFCLSKDPKTEYLNHINNKHNVQLPIFTSADNIVSRVKALRGQIVNSAKPYSGLSSDVRSAYKSMLQSDRPILGESIPDAEVDRRIWQDEFRFHISCALSRTISQNKFDIREYEILLKLIEYGWPGKDHVDELVAVCCDPSNRIVTIAEISILKGFICSSDFLYFPVSVDHIGSQTLECSYEDDEVKEVANRNFSAYNALQNLSQQPRCDLEKVISSAKTVFEMLG